MLRTTSARPSPSRSPTLEINAVHDSGRSWPAPEEFAIAQRDRPQLVPRRAGGPPDDGEHKVQRQCGIEATVAVKIAERRLVSEGHDCAGLVFEQQRVPHESAVTT